MWGEGGKTGESVFDLIFPRMSYSSVSEDAPRVSTFRSFVHLIIGGIERQDGSANPLEIDPWMTIAQRRPVEVRQRARAL